MPSNDDIIFEYPSVYDEYKDEDWYLWFGSDDCQYYEKIDEEDYVPIRKIPKNPFMFVQVCAVAGKQAARIRSPLDLSGFWICDPRLIGARSDRWDFRLEFSTRSYGFPKLLQFVFDSEKHVSLDNNDECKNNYKVSMIKVADNGLYYESTEEEANGVDSIAHVESTKSKKNKITNNHQDNGNGVHPMISNQNGEHQNHEISIHEVDYNVPSDNKTKISDIQVIKGGDNEESFNKEFSDVPWFSLRFKDNKFRKLVPYFEVSTLPSLVTFDPGGLITNAKLESSFFLKGERMMQTRIEDPKRPIFKSRQ